LVNVDRQEKPRPSLEPIVTPKRRPPFPERQPYLECQQPKRKHTPQDGHFFAAFFGA
jgi:hypothetical protein